MGTPVQETYVEQFSFATSVSATLTGVAAGSLLVAHVTWGTVSGMACTVSDGSAYSAADSQRDDAGNAQSSHLFYLPNSGGGSVTITASFAVSGTPTSAEYRGIHVYEVSGIDTASPLDQATGQFQASPGTGADGVSSGATSATTNANDFVMGFTAETSTGTGSGTTAGTGFTLFGTAHFLTGEYKSVSATGAQTATFNQSANDRRITYVVAFKDAGGGGGNTVAVPLATISLDAKTPTITATANNSISVPLATMTLAAQTPTVVASDLKNIAVPKASITLDAFAPTVTTTVNQSIAVPKASITLDAFAPVVTATANNNISIPLATISLNGFAPSVAVGGNQSVSVPLATVSLNAFAPTVTATDAQNIAVPLATMTLAANAPTVTAAANQNISVPAATITLNGFAPTVSLSDNQFVQVPTGSLTLTGIAPTVDSGGPQTIQVPLAAISITVYAPTVINSSQTDQPSGGWWPDYDHARRQRDKRRRELEAQEREQEAIEDTQAREIAALMRAQEVKDADRADLERLQKLADTYAATTKIADLPKAARVAILNAQDARTFNALDQMRRVMEQVEADEILAVQQTILLMLD